MDSLLRRLLKEEDLEPGTVRAEHDRLAERLDILRHNGDITIDAAANNSDIILKGTDGGSDTTFLTIDGSAAGKATFNDEIVSGAVITSGAGLIIADAGNIGSASIQMQLQSHLMEL